MKKRTKITAVLTTAFMLAALGGVAIAKTGSSSKSGSAAEVTAPDTDNVQEGDQTTPDNGVETAEADGTDTAEGTDTAGESAQESDGPGGHEDPAGNIDHQFDGEE